MKTGDIFACKDKIYPHGAVRISDVAGGLVDFAALGGGEIHKLRANTFLTYFEPAPTAPPAWEQGEFSLDDGDTWFPGFSQGFLWNGWDRPVLRWSDLVEALGADWDHKAEDGRRFVRPMSPPDEWYEVHLVEIKGEYWWDSSDIGLCWLKKEGGG